MQLKSLRREPLLHFVAIGPALFFWFQWSGGGAGLGAMRIALTGGQIEHLAASCTRAWQRAPTDAELKWLIDDSVREEIAVREATAAGLDREDTIIRRRLRQKFEFLTEEAGQSVAPTHGTELPPGRSALLYSMGFVVMTGCLHAAGIGIGAAHRWAWGRTLLRADGAAVAAGGVFFMWRALA